ncbi:hypothetical protein J4458_02480 [Candidatus Woesearchaeota archaeon]|nr:hypothetical protein [Candidatus Woesearchaeota archaeon]
MKAKHKAVIMLAIVFVFGWLLNDIYTHYFAGLYLRPVQNENFGKYFLVNVIGQEPVERASPADIIKERQINVEDSQVIINVKNAKLASFADTNSMDPVLDETANAISVAPETEDSIKIGDIVSYYSKEKKAILVHRVISTGYDSNGKYFILKGDNNTEADPEKVRFSQVRRVIVMIIY